MKLTSLFPIKSLFLLLSASVFTFAPLSPATAETIDQCVAREESFGFSMEDYAMEHQGWAMMDLTVDFRYVDQPVAERKNYVNFVPMAAEIDRFLKEYPNERDYWEIVNRHLVEKLLAENPELDALKIKMAIKSGSGDEGFNRHSTVSVTREGGCPLTHS